MAVHVLIPVFNRLPMTRQVLQCLRRQRDVQLNIVVIDDGSSDGTDEYLAAQPDVRVIKGDGSLWWGGAIQLGLDHVLSIAAEQDFVLLVNNDTEFGDTFVSELVAASQRHGRAVVGSIIRHRDPPHDVLSVGPRVDFWHFAVSDLLGSETGQKAVEDEADLDVPMVSGRGTLYPQEAFRSAGCMHPSLLPHYYADYELANRVRRSGIPVKVTCRAAVLSLPEWGNEGGSLSWWQRLFSRRSASNLFYTWAFWSMVGSPAQRLTAIPRWLAQRAKRMVFSLFW